MSVQEYLNKHMLSRKIEDAVNAAVRAKSPDPVLFIANHMRKAVSSVITKIKARQILDSRGVPTVEVDLFTNKGMFRASAPSGDPAGMYEAFELRDGDKGVYLGNSVNRAVKNINEKISKALIGMDPTLQSQIDHAMIDLDKTEKKSELGANAILAVSIAACKAGAGEKEVPLYKYIADLAGRTHFTLPTPAFTVISGGKHAGNNLAIQDIMILPTGASRFEEALQMGTETYYHLKAVITEKHGAHGCNVGVDGGFAPNISSIREGLDLVKEAISRTMYTEKIKIAIGVAATNFCQGTKYDLDFKTPNKSGQNFKSGEDMIEMYKELCAEYPIVSIEDPFDKEDWEHIKCISGLEICQVVEINKSLLTLGRVINALVEHSGHVPYRDSKLTRLLRDSLGGKTKTCIIATISPSIHCLEETLSTLDYAHRAKNIKNKPEINQKMMKSALIKDLYSEIDRLKQEVYAAREKNGIYIPRDRYLHEEAEKKAMAEKIERMELDSDSKDKQLMELQELYDSQQLLTAELSEKLERTERKLEETERSLSDLEEKHRQANATIKEKEFLISNLLKSEKALVERAFELRSELENAASDVSNLFAKIERKDKIEEGNRVLIQKFQSQLTQQLEILHKTVAASATQQEQQLRDMEEDMQSFVSTKAEATEQLRGRLGKLKVMYGSGIKNLDGIAGELDGNSHSTFGDLNSEVSKHSHALEDLFKGIASEADALLNDLQSSLHSQEEKLTAFAQQQREAHSRAVENARSVSTITVNFFKTLDSHASNLGQIVEEAQTVNDNKLSEFEQKFEECAAKEERQLLEKVAELLASSNARKKQLVQMAVDDLRESASSRTSKLQKEMSTMQESTSTVKAEWTVHMEKTESHYIEDTSAVESGKKDLEAVLQNCLEKATVGARQWKNAQESLLSLEKSNVASVDSIVRGGMEANQNLRDLFSSAVSTALEDADAANNNLLTSIDNSLQLDHDACANLNSMIVPCCGDLRELKGGHYHRIVEITENAGKCLLDEYTVDEPSCSTPRKRSFNLPSIASIEELRTPAFEELLKSFWDSKSAKLANGDIKHVAGAYESAQSFRDSRVPLTAIN